MADQPADSVDRDVAANVDPGFGPAPPWTPRLVVERVRVWAAFVGPGRLAGAAGAVLVIVGVGWWLLRSPALPTEAALPTVTHAAAATTSSSIVNSGGADPTSTAPGTVVIHVTGAVNQPGVYELTSGDRVDDALAVAGGPTPDADANALNLAAPVIDGDRIAVPVLSQEHTSGTPGPDAGVTHAVVEDAGSLSVEPVDLNEATSSDLEALPGIGPATAAAIVEYRTQTGPFGSVEELLDVPGIGPAKLDAIRDAVVV